ncbi:hypothetical protein HY604_01990 [Candidatus Peregrinibacteria bacterium]|nr:hypothetical protein [Candidatus Peregrinibacteria bacterium]
MSDFSKFKAAMFDFDGTVTVPGNYEPSQEMADALVKLTRKMPIAFCTGRQLESFEDHGLETLIKEIPKAELEHFFENLVLIAENGSIGYKFNSSLDEFEEFYRVNWPDEIIGREELMQALDHRIKDFGRVYFRKHRVVVVIRTNEHESGDFQAISRCSDQIYEVCKEFMAEILPDYERFFHIGNSGIGVIICPAIGDKNRGIQEFGKYLVGNRGIEFSKNFKEILVAGDRPEEGGNDFYFLDGKYGTPFTVGNLCPKNDLLEPVIDIDGERLTHDKATIFLISQMTS